MATEPRETAKRLSLLVKRFLVLCRVVVLHQGAMRDRGAARDAPRYVPLDLVPSAFSMIQLALSGAISLQCAILAVRMQVPSNT